MHKSRLAGFIIDCKADDVRSAATFWSAALGMELRTLPGKEGEKYMQLVDPSDRLHVEVQSVSHPSRVHLDIESDDVDGSSPSRGAGCQARSTGSNVVGHGGAYRAALLRGPCQARGSSAANAPLGLTLAEATLG